MKASMVFLTIFTTTVLVNCKKDDPEPAQGKLSTNNSMTQLVGTWLETSASTTSCNIAVNNSPDMPCTVGCKTYVFTETKATFYYSGTNSSGDYTVKGDSILMPFLKSFNLNKRTFIIIGSKVTFSYPSANCIVNNTYTKQP